MESYQHNQVKLAVATGLQLLATARRSGVVFTDGMFLHLPTSEQTVMPDAFYVSYRNLRNGCRFRRNTMGRVLGIDGLPSLVVEVASPSRLQADYEDKLKRYERHGVKEFWLFRPAGPSYEFDLLTLDRTGRYYRQRPYGQGGYSKVLRMYASLGTLPTPVKGLPGYQLQLSPERR